MKTRIEMLTAAEMDLLAVKTEQQKAVFEKQVLKAYQIAVSIIAVAALWVLCFA